MPSCPSNKRTPANLTSLSFGPELKKLSLLQLSVSILPSNFEIFFLKPLLVHILSYKRLARFVITYESRFFRICSFYHLHFQLVSAALLDLVRERNFKVKSGQIPQRIRNTMITNMKSLGVFRWALMLDKCPRLLNSPDTNRTEMATGGGTRAA